MKNVLTIAGSDSCGGAGIRGRHQNLQRPRTYGMSAITAVTAQNTAGVLDIREMDADIVRKQIECLFEDIQIDGVKIGMVSGIEIIDAIAGTLEKKKAKNIVVDPVMISKSGYHLLKPQSMRELLDKLFPLALVVTPNLHEAALITGESIGTVEEMKKAAVKIHGMGARNVVVKGGHLAGDAIDVLYDGDNFECIKGTRINTRNTHGTGCTYSSVCVTAFIAKGYAVREAVRLAKAYINGAIENSIGLGHGVGPTNHFYELYKKAGIITD